MLNQWNEFWMPQCLCLGRPNAASPPKTFIVLWKVLKLISWNARFLKLLLILPRRLSSSVGYKKTSSLYQGSQLIPWPSPLWLSSALETRAALNALPISPSSPTLPLNLRVAANTGGELNTSKLIFVMTLKDLWSLLRQRGFGGKWEGPGRKELDHGLDKARVREIAARYN